MINAWLNSILFSVLCFIIQRFSKACWVDAWNIAWINVYLQWIIFNQERSQLMTSLFDHRNARWNKFSHLLHHRISETRLTNHLIQKKYANKMNLIKKRKWSSFLSNPSKSFGYYLRQILFGGGFFGLSKTFFLFGYFAFAEAGLRRPAIILVPKPQSLCRRNLVSYQPQITNAIK